MFIKQSKNSLYKTPCCQKMSNSNNDDAAVTAAAATATATTTATAATTTTTATTTTATVSGLMWLRRVTSLRQMFDFQNSYGYSAG
jgi:hypothetical protein